MNDRELMQQALEAIISDSPVQRAAAVRALRARLAEPGLCRTDGRCQYAIDSGAEGEGHCPKGKCVMPALAEPQTCKPALQEAARPLTPVQEAAPELLEALKAALQLIETISPFFRDDSDFIPYDALLQITKGDVVRNARAAYAKAGANDD